MYHCRAANKPSFKRLFPSSVRACKMQFAKIVNKYIDMVLFCGCTYWIFSNLSLSCLIACMVVWLPASFSSLPISPHFTESSPSCLPTRLSICLIPSWLPTRVCLLSTCSPCLSVSLSCSLYMPACFLAPPTLSSDCIPTPPAFLSHFLLPSLLPCSLCIIADKPWMIWVHVWPVQTSFFCLIEYYTVEVREINKICFNH